jgi:hypothetical protein
MRANKILSGEKGVIFARVVKHEGMGHVAAMIDSRQGPVQIKVQIPTVFGRKGSTPINSNTIIAIYVGEGFDPTKFEPSTHFRIETIMSEQQAYELAEDGVIPTWMVRGEKKGESNTILEESGFEFDRSLPKDEEEEEEEESEVKEKKEAKEIKRSVETKKVEAVVSDEEDDPERAAEAEAEAAIAANKIVYSKVDARNATHDYEFSFE